MLKTIGPDLTSILKNPLPVLAVFYAEWCPFCRSFLPEFERLHSDKFETAEVDISDWNNPLWETYRVDVVPTLIAFEQGAEVARQDGRRGVGLNPRDIESVRARLEHI